MNCKKCGKTIPENINYCPSCSLAENPSYAKYVEEQKNKENPPSIETPINSDLNINSLSTTPLQEQQIVQPVIVTPEVQPSTPQEPITLIDNEQKLLKKAKACFTLGLVSAVGVILGLILMFTGGQAGGMIVLLLVGPIINFVRLILLIIMVFQVIFIIKNSIKWKLHIKKVYAFMLVGLILWTFPFIYNATIRTVRTMKPFTPTAGDMSFSLSSCLEKEERNQFISDIYLAEEMVCSAYRYKQANGRMPNTYEEVKPFIKNKAILETDFEVVFDGTEPKKYGVISIVENKHCGSYRDGDEPGVISGWLKDPDPDKKYNGKHIHKGLYCVSGKNW